MASLEFDEDVDLACPWSDGVLSWPAQGSPARELRKARSCQTWSRAGSVQARLRATVMGARDGGCFVAAHSVILQSGRS